MVYMLIKKLQDDIKLVKQVSKEICTRKFISTLFILFFVQIFFTILLDFYLNIKSG